MENKTNYVEFREDMRNNIEFDEEIELYQDKEFVDTLKNQVVDYRFEKLMKNYIKQKVEGIACGEWKGIKFIPLTDWDDGGDFVICSYKMLFEFAKYLEDNGDHFNVDSGEEKQ